MRSTSKDERGLPQLTTESINDLSSTSVTVEEEGDTQACDHPSKEASRQRRRRVWLFVVSLVSTFLYGGAYYGWGPMQLMLESAGSYAWKCDPEDMGQCQERTQALVNIRLISQLALLASPVFGEISDRYGARMVAHLQGIVCIVGSLLLAISLKATSSGGSSTNLDWLLHITFWLFSLSAWANGNLIVETGLVFRGKARGRVISAMSSTYDSAMMTYLGLRGLTQVGDEGLEEWVVVAMYFVLAIITFVGLSYLWNTVVPAEQQDAAPAPPQQEKPDDSKKETKRKSSTSFGRKLGAEIRLSVLHEDFIEDQDELGYLEDDDELGERYSLPAANDQSYFHCEEGGEEEEVIFEDAPLSPTLMPRASAEGERDRFKRPVFEATKRESGTSRPSVISASTYESTRSIMSDSSDFEERMTMVAVKADLKLSAIKLRMTSDRTFASSTQEESKSRNNLTIDSTIPEIADKGQSNLGDIQEKEKKPSSIPADYIIVADRSPLQQLRSEPFVMLATFFTIQLTSNVWALTTARDFLAYLGDDEVGNRYLSIFTLLGPASLAAVPCVDTALNKYGFHVALQTVNVLAIGYTLIKVATNNLNVQIVGFVLFSFYRSFLFSVSMTCLPNIVSRNMVGRSIGVFNITSGLAGFLNIPLANMALTRFDGNFFVPNLFFCLVNIPCIFLVWRVGKGLERDRLAKEAKSIEIHVESRLEAMERAQPARFSTFARDSIAPGVARRDRGARPVLAKTQSLRGVPSERRFSGLQSNASGLQSGGLQRSGLQRSGLEPRGIGLQRTGLQRSGLQRGDNHVATKRSSV